MKSRPFRHADGVLICAVPALACAQQSQQQDQTPTAAAAPELGSVTVTASRVPTEARDQPIQVSVLTQEQIRTSSALTVQELLSTQAGVHVINSTGAVAQAQVDLRGFGIAGFSNTLILIDGVPQNNNDLSAPSLGTVPLDRIERIEIVRGSGSVQYGGGTTGGVINILTKRGNPGGQP